MSVRSNWQKQEINKTRAYFMLLQNVCLLFNIIYIHKKLLIYFLSPLLITYICYQRCLHQLRMCQCVKVRNFYLLYVTYNWKNNAFAWLTIFVGGRETFRNWNKLQLFTVYSSLKSYYLEQVSWRLKRRSCTHRQTDEHTNGQTDRQTDRKTDRHTWINRLCQSSGNSYAFFGLLNTFAQS